MSNYNIPSLGAIVQLDRMPNIRFLVGSADSFELERTVSTSPMVVVRSRVLSRAEVLVDRESVAFALDGIAGLEAIEDERAARIAEANAYEEALAAREAAAAAAVEETPAPRRRRGPGRPPRNPEPEVEAEAEAAVDDEELIAPEPWSFLDTVKVLAIDIDEVSIDQPQLIPLLQAAPVVARMQASPRNADVIQNNYEKLVNAAAEFNRATDALHQADPTTIPQNEFMMPSAVGQLDELDSETRRVNMSGIQTHQQRLRNRVDVAQQTFDNIMNWFATHLLAQGDVSWQPFDSAEFTLGAITVSQTEVVNLFFKNEFVEVK